MRRWNVPSNSSLKDAPSMGRSLSRIKVSLAPPYVGPCWFGWFNDYLESNLSTFMNSPRDLGSNTALCLLCLLCLLKRRIRRVHMGVNLQDTNANDNHKPDPGSLLMRMSWLLRIRYTTSTLISQLQLSCAQSLVYSFCCPSAQSLNLKCRVGIVNKQDWCSFVY